MSASRSSKPGRPRDEQRVARRQEEILATAMSFFAEFGYRQADVQLLADRLGIGKGTIYRYFPTKEALFSAAVDAGMRELTDEIDAAVRDEPDPVLHISKAIRTYLCFFDRNPALIELLIIERAEFRDRKEATYFAYKARNQDKWRGFLEDAIHSGVIRDLPLDRIMNVISDTLYGTIFTNHFSRRKIPLEQQAHDVLDVVLHGILAAERHRPSL